MGAGDEAGPSRRPPGTGKTTLVEAAASDLGYHVIELNASDLRTKEALRMRIGALASASLVQEKRLLFLDEVDGLFGRADFGGLEFVVDSIGDLTIPLAMAANYEDSDQVKKLAKASTLMRMRPVSERLLEIYVRHVLAAERATLSDEAVTEAVTSATGDVRAAVNNVQSAFMSGKPLRSMRNRILSLADGITLASSTADREEAVRALRDADGQPDEKLMAAFSTIISSDLTTERRQEAPRSLTKANELMGGIMRTQRWRQLRYFDRLLADSLFGLHSRYIAEDLPWPVKLRIWNDGRYLKGLRIVPRQGNRVSRGDAASFYLHAAVLVYGRAGTLAKVCLDAGFDEKVVNALEREYKL